MNNIRERDSREVDIIDRIFENRKIFNKDKFLNPSKDSIQNPFEYKNMKRAVDSILENIEKGTTIAIVPDSDVDGVCSASMLYMYIKYIICYDNVFYIMHEEKEHGLTEHIMEQVLLLKPSLLIMPDASSNDFEQHEKLFNEEIDVLVIDHHIVDRYSDHAIVVNNQLNEYGNKDLSGAGMVLKVLQALDSRLKIDESYKFYDLAAVALVGDAMDITKEETKYYVMEGLKNINNPFLKKLVEGEENLEIQTISYKIAPCINAILRVGDKELKKNLVETLSFTNRKEFINLRGKGDVEVDLEEYVARMSTRARAKQTKFIKTVLEDEETIFLDKTLPFIIVIHRFNEYKALNGLIAMKVAERYNRPAIVIMRSEDDYIGSGRTIKEFENFRDYLKNSELFDVVAGHMGAFGVVFKEEQMDNIINFYKDKTLNINDIRTVDKIYTNYVSSYDILGVKEIKKHFCKGFEEPSFLINLSNVNKNILTFIGKNKNTLKFKYDYIDYVKFNIPINEIEKIKNLSHNVDISILGKFEVNIWNNITTPQVIIEKIEIKEIKPTDFSWGNFNAFG